MQLNGRSDQMRTQLLDVKPSHGGALPQCRSVYANQLVVGEAQYIQLPQGLLQLLIVIN